MENLAAIQRGPARVDCWNEYFQRRKLLIYPSFQVEGGGRKGAFYMSSPICFLTCVHFCLQVKQRQPEQENNDHHCGESGTFEKAC